MKSVTLFVTGRLEEGALADSLRQVFGGVELTTHKLEGFTSNRLPRERSTDEKRRYADAIAGRLVGEAFPGRTGKPPDLVIAVDDLELANQDQPEVVVEHLAGAVRDHVERHFQAGARDRAYETVRRRCSFHLLCPMVEAYFFGEPAALTRAGAVRPSLFAEATTDVEAFDVDDAAFLAPPDVDDKHDWRRSDRRKHPKRYLKFLSDADANGDSKYAETHGGADALRTLAWSGVLRHQDRARFARSLFEDLAEGLGRSSPYPGDVAEVTWCRGRSGILRNV